MPWCLVLYLYQRWNLSPDHFMVLLLFGLLVCAAAGYFIGSISPSIILSRRLLDDDVRRHGSGNAGTTNMLRNYGAKFAVITLLLDMLKAGIAMALGYLVYAGDGAAFAGFFAVFGHMFPIYYRFRGGKGVACSAMVALCLLHPVAFCILIAVYVAILLMTRYVSLASIMTVLLFPLVVNAFHPEEGLRFLSSLLITIFVVFMHRENIKRLYERKESKIDFSKFKIKKKSKPKSEESGDEQDQ
jgi:glycerol-3-phosphate acyltransferase PlsY